MLNDWSYKVRAILKQYCPGNIKKILPFSQSAWNTRFYFGHQKLCMDNNMNYLRISIKLFSFCLINPQLSCSVRKVSVKCSETVVMNLHIIGNTFVIIRINSHTLHFHHSDWFQSVRDC